MLRLSRATLICMMNVRGWVYNPQRVESKGRGMNFREFGWRVSLLAGIGCAALWLASSDATAQEEPFCGNRSIEIGEQCDDGNSAAEDGCSSVCLVEEGFICTGEPSRCRLEGEQTRDQQRCILSLNRSLQTVSRTLGREIITCLRENAQGRLSTLIETCISSDPRGRVARAMKRSVKNAVRNCEELPNFGPMDPNAVNAAAEQKELDLIHDIFGPNLDNGVFVAPFRDRTKPLCQVMMARSVQHCQDARLTTYNECKRVGLANGTIVDSAGLEACLEVDPRRDIERTCDSASGRLVRDIDTRCNRARVDLLDAFPGCDPRETRELASCIDARIKCRVCLALNDAEGLALDCDVYDDGAGNGSCP